MTIRQLAGLGFGEMTEAACRAFAASGLPVPAECAGKLVVCKPTPGALPGTSPLYRPGDEWDQFCVDAAKTWAAVTGDQCEATRLQHTCIEKNQKLPCSTFATPPWTVAGLACRGLPQNFSSSYEKTKGGAGGAIITAVGEAVPMVQQAKGSVDSVMGGGSATTGVFVPVIGTTIDSTQMVKNVYGTGGQAGQAGGGEVDLPFVGKTSTTTLLLGLGAVGLLALFVVRKRRSRGVAGFGGYSRRKRRVRRRR